MKLKGYLKNRAIENKGIFLVNKDFFLDLDNLQINNILEYETNLMGDFTIYDYE